MSADTPPAEEQGGQEGREAGPTLAELSQMVDALGDEIAEHLKHLGPGAQQ